MNEFEVRIGPRRMLIAAGSQEEAEATARRDGHHCLTCHCLPCVCGPDEMPAVAVPMAPTPSGCTRCPYHCPGQNTSDALDVAGALTVEESVRLIGASRKLLRACQRAHRNVCGSSMGPNCDLARELREAIHAALGVRP